MARDLFVIRSDGLANAEGVLGLSLSAPTGPLPLLSSEELNFVETKLFLLTYVSS